MSIRTKFNLGYLLKTSAMEALQHQLRVADKLKHDDQQGLLLYHGLGSGKTFSAINAAKELKLPLLAIVPASLRENFKKEIDKSGFTGETKVVSYEEALKKKDDEDFQNYAEKSLVVYDEAHRMGHGESARSTLPKDIKSLKTLMLTGTPIRNYPEELIPLMRSLGSIGFPKDKATFKDRYIGKKTIYPNILSQKWYGLEPGEYDVPKNLKDFQLRTKDVVDYHSSYDPENYPEVHEKIVEIPMTISQYATYQFMMGKFPALAYKITNGLPPSKSEATKMQAFMTGPRLVSNDPRPFSVSAQEKDAPKIKAVVDDILKKSKGDKNFKGVVFSNYLEHGIEPIATELDKAGIKYNKFTGEINDKRRKEIINDYNSGTKPVLLISSAGGEGLDLKGTKMVQILEPHWNEEKLEQVKGRAIRYQSHSHLPDNERNVDIIRYHSVLPSKAFEMAKAFIKMRPSSSTDQYLYGLSMKKRKLNDEFLKAMRGEKVQPDKDGFSFFGDLVEKIFGTPIDTGDHNLPIEKRAGYYKEDKATIFDIGLFTGIGMSLDEYAKQSMTKAAFDFSSIDLSPYAALADDAAMVALRLMQGRGMSAQEAKDEINRIFGPQIEELKKLPSRIFPGPGEDKKYEQQPDATPPQEPDPREGKYASYEEEEERKAIINATPALAAPLAADYLAGPSINALIGNIEKYDNLADDELEAVVNRLKKQYEIHTEIPSGYTPGKDALMFNSSIDKEKVRRYIASMKKKLDIETVIDNMGPVKNIADITKIYDIMEQNIDLNNLSRSSASAYHPNLNVIVRAKNPVTALHEIGHQRILNAFPGFTAISDMARTALPMAVPAAAYALYKYDKEDYIPLAGLLAQSPTLGHEAAASGHAMYNIAKDHGILSAPSQRAGWNLLKSFGTYAAAPALSYAILKHLFPSKEKTAEGIDDFQAVHITPKDAPSPGAGVGSKSTNPRPQQIGRIPPEKIAALKNALIKLAPKNAMRKLINRPPAEILDASKRDLGSKIGSREDLSQELIMKNSPKPETPRKPMFHAHDGKKIVLGKDPLITGVN